MPTWEVFFLRNKLSVKWRKTARFSWACPSQNEIHLREMPYRAPNFSGASYALPEDLRSPQTFPECFETFPLPSASLHVFGFYSITSFKILSHCWRYLDAIALG